MRIVTSKTHARPLRRPDGVTRSPFVERVLSATSTPPLTVPTGIHEDAQRAVSTCPGVSVSSHARGLVPGGTGDVDIPVRVPDVHPRTWQTRPGRVPTR